MSWLIHLENLYLCIHCKHSRIKWKLWDRHRIVCVHLFISILKISDQEDKAIIAWHLMNLIQVCIWLYANISSNQKRNFWDFFLPTTILSLYFPKEFEVCKKLYQQHLKIQIKFWSPALLPWNKLFKLEQRWLCFSSLQDCIIWDSLHCETR